MTVLTLVEAKIKPQRANDVTRLLRDALPSTRSFGGSEIAQGSRLLRPIPDQRSIHIKRKGEVQWLT